METLGSTDVICTDKTGTLTEGRMVLSRFWADSEELMPGRDGEAKTASPSRACCEPPCDARTPACGAPPMASNGRETRARAPCSWPPRASARTSSAPTRTNKRRRRLYHFDARVKRMTTADEEPDGSLWYRVKGAPLELLGRCTTKRAPDGADIALREEDREKVRRAFERYAGEGLRVLGFAERKVPGPDPDEERDGAESHLTFLGLAALEDPPRPDVAEAVSRCLKAGIRIIVVTGDHGLTAHRRRPHRSAS